MKKVIVIAPHPDDETLGCGGTLLKHKFKGDKIYWLIVTSMNKNDIWSSSTIKKREKKMIFHCRLYTYIYLTLLTSIRN